MRRLTRLAPVLLASGVAWATPSTLIWIPSTDTQATATWHLGVDDYFTIGRGSSAPTDVGLTYGLTRRVEVGIDFWGDTQAPFLFNAKFKVFDSPGRGWAGSVGIYNVGTDAAETGYDIAYALVSKECPFGRLHAGWFVGRDSLLEPDSEGVLLGFDRQLCRKWWAAVDFQGGESSFGALNLGAAYSFSENASVLFGVDLYNNADLHDTVTVQVDVNL
jgi:hypothetical protein